MANEKRNKFKLYTYIYLSIYTQYLYYTYLPTFISISRHGTIHKRQMYLEKATLDF